MVPQRSSTHAPLLPQLPSIAYGGDYNPEQWDEQTFHEDLDLMVETGVNLVSLGIFSWARLEPSEGVYDFDWLATIIDQLHERGIFVDLATGTASPPAWMATEHPDILPVTDQGVRLGFGSRQHTCLSSEYLVAKQAALAGELAKRFSNHPAVVMWHVNNEYSCHVSQCFCTQCAQAFRAWLQQRYTSLATLNRAWGTAFWSQQYSDWAQICPPAAMPTWHNPGQLLDWYRFCDHQMRAMFLAEKQAIKRFSTMPVTTNFMGSHPWLDHWKWAQVVDLVSNDAYPDPASPGGAWECAWHGDLERSLAGGSWLLMEQSPSAVQWRPRNSPKRPGQFALWSLSSVGRGADGILQFQWRQSAAGSETFHAGMIPHAGRQSRTFHEVRDFGALLPRLASVRGSCSRADVAIVIDWDSEWARYAAIGPVPRGEHFAEARAWHRSFWEAGLATDFVPVDADFSAYTIVVIPGVFIDYPQMSAALEQAARAGTQVLVSTPTAVLSADGSAITGGYLGSLRDLLGVAVIDHHALSGPVSPLSEREGLTHRISRAVGTPGAHTWLGLQATFTPMERVLDRLGTPSPDLRGGMWAEEISVHLPPRLDGDPATQRQHHLACAYPDLWATLDTDVEPVAVFDGRGGGADVMGRAAITRRRLDSGAAWYVATDLDSVGRSAMVQLLSVYGRVRPALADLPDGVEAISRGQNLFVLNHSDRAVELSGVVGVDLLTGNQCTGHVMVAPRSGMVIAPSDGTHYAGQGQ